MEKEQETLDLVKHLLGIMERAQETQGKTNECINLTIDKLETLANRVSTLEGNIERLVGGLN